MNPTDISVDTGLNVVTVAGLDKVYKEIKAAAARGITDGVSVGAERAKEKLESYVELRGRAAKSGGVAERMGALLAARARLNVASSMAGGLTNESAIILAAERETLAQEINRTRGVFKKNPGGKYSSRAISSVSEALVVTPDNRIITKGEYLEKQQKSAMETWLGTQTNIVDKGIEKLSLPELVRAREQLKLAYKTSLDLDEYRASRGSKKRIITPGEQSEYDESMLLINKEIAKNTKKGAEGTQALLKGYKEGLGIFAAGAAGARIAQSISEDINAYYGSDKPFSTMRERLYSRTTLGGTVVGGGAGAALGALVGTILTAVTGGAAAPLIPILTGVGGGAGGFATNMWLNSQLAHPLSAAQQSQNMALQTLRYRGLYGATAGEGGWQFAKAMEATGLATAEDAEALASSSQMFQSALAFGGVSDSQMLGLSMLPNYYAALAGGATPDQAFSAYMQDIEGMSPGLAQYASKLAGVPDNLRALANNPSIANRMLTEGYGTAVGLEREMGAYALGFAHPYYETELLNMKERRSQWAEARKQDVPNANLNYDPSYEGSYYYDQNTSKYIRYDKSKAPPYTSPTGLGSADKDGKDLVKRELNIYVNGGERTTIGHVYTDAEIGDQISYAIGEM